MANKRDYYEVLGISKNASSDEIKRAFRKKAMEYHPDRNKAPDAETKFKEVNEANEILSDPQKRQMYDQYGHAGVNGQQGFGGQGGGFDDIFSQFFKQGNGQNVKFSFGGDEEEDGGLGDIFGSIFGGGQRRKQTRTKKVSKDIEVQLDINFSDMVKGGNKAFNYKVKNNCPHCHGTGAETPNDIKTCDECHGSGVVNVRQRTPFGVIESQTTCPKCGGRGKIITRRCHVCNGSGYVENIEKIEVNIPAGIDNGAIIRVSGRGHKTYEGAGDLLIHIYIKPSSIFERKGNTIFVKVLVDPLTAILGGEITVPTPYGLKEVTIKPQTGNGDHIVISGAGLNIKKGVFGGKGDLEAIIIYAKPSNYSKAEIEKMNEFKNKTNSDVESYLKKIKAEIE
ncbi:MAG: molecular chaperone DnaJ [Mycoplasmataceae bacterium]|jgi:molecular chaperone DnaJ|nr:molecular chaperone DnaJ [Mycoplasmataceae bacterium]